MPFGVKHTPEEVRRGPRRAPRGFLRGEVGRALRCGMRRKLEFVFDEQIENADKLTRLIDGAVKSRSADRD